MIVVTPEVKKRILNAVRSLHWHIPRADVWLMHGSGVVIVRNFKIYLIATLHSFSSSGVLINPSDAKISELKISVTGFEDNICAKLISAGWKRINSEDRYEEEKDFIIYEMDSKDEENARIFAAPGYYASLPKQENANLPNNSDFVLCGYTKGKGAQEKEALIPKILPCKMVSIDDIRFKCVINKEEIIDLNGCSGGGIFSFCGKQQIPICVGLIQQISNNIVHGISYPFIRSMIDSVESTPLK